MSNINLQTISDHHATDLVSSGDEVIVVRAVPSHSGGWKNTWTEFMNEAIGRTFVVRRALTEGVYFDDPRLGTLGFPIHALAWADPARRDDVDDTPTLVADSNDTSLVSIGDTVYVARKVPSFSMGWFSNWGEGMDEMIGKAYEVVDVNASAGVYLREPGKSGFWFPAHALAWPENVHRPSDLFIDDQVAKGEFRAEFTMEDNWEKALVDEQRARRERCRRYVAERRERRRAYHAKVAMQLNVRRRWRYDDFVATTRSGRVIRIGVIRSGVERGKSTAKALARYLRTDKASIEALESLCELSSLYWNGPYQVRPVLNDRVGEVLFLAVSKHLSKMDSVWQEPPWSDEDWYVNSPHRWRFAHISTEDPTKVAFTENVDKLERNIQTRVKPGRFLQKYFSDVLTAKEIRKWSERFAAQASALTTLRFVENTDPDGWEWVYENAHGFTSCMQYDRDTRYLDDECYGKDHPVRAYAYPGNGLRLAYLGDAVGTDGGRVYARAIVRNNADGTPQGFVRIYGDDRILAYLRETGYGGCTDLSGVRLAKRTMETEDRVKFICPYLDGSADRVIVHADHLEVVKHGGIDASSSSGLIDYEEYVCPRCDASHSDEGNIHYGHGDLVYCSSCGDDIVFAVVGGTRFGGLRYEDVRDDDTVTINGEVYLDDHGLLESLGFVLCEECGEWEDQGEMTTTSRGPICSCTDLVELAAPDPYGNNYAHPMDTVVAIDTETGDEVSIHEDTGFDERYVDPDTWDGVTRAIDTEPQASLPL